MRVSLVYAIVGSCYVALGDVGVSRFTGDPETALIAQLIKGGIFVLLSAGIIWFLVDREMQERQDAERSARDAQRLETVTRLAGGVAHEFNNVLTTILGHATLLAEMNESAAERARHTEELRDAVARATRLTRQLVLFSGTQVDQPALLRLVDVLGELRGVFTGILPERTALHLNVAADLWPVWCDAAQVQQLVLNLVANAHEADATTIRITSENVRRPDPDGGTVDEWVRLVVADDGRGMSRDTLDHAFEPFFSTREHGAGLGLATVHGIVRQCGGQVAIDSSPDGGTTVEVLLPRGDEPEPADTSVAHDAGAAATLLVVEDDTAVRELTVRVLRRQGHEVLAAANAADALRVAGSCADLDLVIADIVMPGMNGVELARQLRHARPGLPILFTSGYTRGSIANTADLDARTWFMEKPYRPDELVTRVSAVLAGT